MPVPASTFDRPIPFAGRIHRLPLAVAFLFAFCPVVSQAQEPDVKVEFVVNDAFVKGKLLGGVEIAMARAAAGAAEQTGFTGANGRLVVSVPPGTWFVTYRLRGYVPVVASETVLRDRVTVVTTSLSMNLESEGGPAGRRVRIVLNWGSNSNQVQDADAHVLCPCLPDNPRVYYQSRTHVAGTHEVSLDVDDRDWGGPETITLRDPAPGAYRYFVHNFSGPRVLLGASEATVRVLSGDEQIGEFRVPADVSQSVWRPFKHLQVSASGDVSIVAFDTEELKRSEDRQVPAGNWKLRDSSSTGSAAAPEAGGGPGTAGTDDQAAVGVTIAVMVVVFAIGLGWKVSRKKPAA